MKLPVLLSILLSATFFLGVISIPNSEAAQVDVFLKIDGVDGEATDPAHKGEIDILAWSWGMSNSGNPQSSGAGAGSGKANFQDLSVTKIADKSSVILMLKCANGDHIDKATLTAVSTGDSKVPVKYFEFVMEDAIVTGISMGGSSGEERHSESVTFNFSKVTWSYTPQKEDGLPAGDPIVGGWDIAKNKEIEPERPG